MAVYVDQSRPTTPSKQWPYKTACHLLADTTNELHDFADRLGLRPHWVQSEGEPLEHFDLTESKRREAITMGAVSIDRHGLSELLDRKRSRKGV